MAAAAAAAAGQATEQPVLPEGVTAEDLCDRGKYERRKRAAFHSAARPEDIYVRRGRSRAALVNRAWRLLVTDASLSEVWVHGLGASVPAALEVALRVEKRGAGAIGVAVRTSTVTLYDDYAPLREGLPHVTLHRNNSAVHVALRRLTDAERAARAAGGGAAAPAVDAGATAAAASSTPGGGAIRQPTAKKRRGDRGD